MRAWMVRRSSERAREAVADEVSAGAGVVAEARANGEQGQQPVAETEVTGASDEVAPSGIVQWCFPFFRQQAGMWDSSTLPVQPEAMGCAGTEARAGLRPEMKARTNVNRMERSRRIRVYRTSDFKKRHCSQVLSEKLFSLSLLAQA